MAVKRSVDKLLMHYFQHISWFLVAPFMHPAGGRQPQTP